MYDQPDYSAIEHPSCEDAVLSCPICGDDHTEAVCPSLVCARCGQHAAWDEIDHDSDICHECEEPSRCKTCERQTEDLIAGRCASCHRQSQVPDDLDLCDAYERLGIDGYRADGTDRTAA